MPKAAPGVNWLRFAKRCASPSGMQGKVLSEAGFVGDGDFRRRAHPAPSYLAFLEQLARFGFVNGVIWVIGSLLRERPSTSTVRALCGHVTCFRWTAVPNRSKRRRPVCRPTPLQGEHKIMRGRDYFYETARQCLVGYRRAGGRGGCGRQFHAPRSRVPPVASVRSRAPTEKYQEPTL